MLSGAADRKVKLWDAATGRLLRTINDGREHGVSTVAFWPDGSRLIGSGDGYTALWDAATGEHVRGPDEVHRASSVAFSPDGVGRLHEATGRPVLTAAATGQFAHEGVIGATGERHGVFTWALLDALHRAEADTNGNGVIELSELVAHVQNVVPKLAAEVRPVSGIQAARIGWSGEDFAIARRLP